MPMRSTCWWAAGLLGAAAIVLPASSQAHRHSHARQHKVAANLRRAKSQRPRAAGSPGVIAIPAAGLKVHCPTHDPLMVRKSTQGQGTTVTVICR